MDVISILTLIFSGIAGVAAVIGARSDLANQYQGLMPTMHYALRPEPYPDRPILPVDWRKTDEFTYGLTLVEPDSLYRIPFLRIEIFEFDVPERWPVARPLLFTKSEGVRVTDSGCVAHLSKGLRRGQCRELRMVRSDEQVGYLRLRFTAWRWGFLRGLGRPWISDTVDVRLDDLGRMAQACQGSFPFRSSP